MFCGCRMLHLCCGRCHIPGAVNVDNQPLPEVDIRADAEALPFNERSFDVILVDPPYSEQDADRYKQHRLLGAKRVLSECRRVVTPNGFVLWLDEKYPVYRRSEYQLVGLIAIVTGFERRTRILSMFRNRG